MNNNIQIIDGGVCAPLGFKANGIHCGIRKNRSKRDLALIVSDTRAASAAVYTTNLVYGAPILVTKEHISDGYAKAMVCNSGNANTCNADGVDIANKMSKITADKLGISEDDVIIASTGVIGQPLDITPIENGMGELVAGLGNNSELAAEAIMTTDRIKKEIAISFKVGGVECKMGGIAKGSGMIHPNMATMLVFLTTDCAISPQMLKKALSTDINSTFNMVSIDGDTSTNDMVSIMANGMAKNEEITCEGEDFNSFMEAINTVNTYLCKLIAGDGEGSTKLLECVVDGAFSEECAKKVAKSVICSSLVKSAMFGADANWGRILCAIGYSGAKVDVKKIDVSFKSDKGEIVVCKNGSGVEFSEEIAKEILLKKDINIMINLNSGEYSATAWGCDLTYDYVRINGDYRT